MSRIQRALYKGKVEHRAFVQGTSMPVTLMGDASLVEARPHCATGLVGGTFGGTTASSWEWWHGAPPKDGTSVTHEVVGALRLRPTM